MFQPPARPTRWVATGHRRRAAPAWAALSAVLAACATTGLEPASRAVEPTAAAEAAVAARPTIGRWRPGTVQGSAFARAVRAAVVPPAAATQTVDDDPDRLLGLNRVSVEKLLGRPRVVRSEAPAEVLQYRATDCVLDLFLYADGGVYRVVFLEARTAAAQPVAARFCLNAVLAARRSPTAS
ncbi:MAG TPA: hypothetical protein VJJ77_03280 [Dongiaceae bacterium]|nr:hypothetical protein [Dongiaceae bacterium]